MHKKKLAWSLHQCINIEDLESTHTQKNPKKLQCSSTGHKSRVHCLSKGGNASTGDPKGSAGKEIHQKKSCHGPTTISVTGDLGMTFKLVGCISA